MDIPEKNKVVVASPPVTTNGGVTGDYISMKNVIKATIIITLTQAVGHATGIDPVQATAVAGTGAKAFTKTLPIAANEDIVASDALVKKTQAVTYNVAADIKNKVVIFEIDAEKLDVNNSFDCIGVTVDDSSQATNFVSINYILEMRYPQNSVIVD